ncbi:uncharacterized protein LOC144344468 [Saccoglossus kowalevskii]
MDLLEKRYGNKQAIINAYMTSLWEQVPPENNPTSLRRFHDELETIIQGLKNLGEDETNYGNLLIPLLLQKLPIEIQRQLARANSDHEWTLSRLSQLMLNEIRILAIGEMPNLDSPQNSTVAAFYTRTASGNYNIARNSYSATPGHNPANNYNPGRKRPSQRQCVYCDEQHNPANCVKISNQRERLDIVKRKQLCYNCLGNHAVKQCKSRYTCRHCQGKHHTSLHDNRTVFSQSEIQNTNVSVNFTHASHNLAKPNHSYQGRCAPDSRSRRVLLKTAQIPASYGGNTALATVLFDEGADRSFITERFVRIVNAEAHSSEILNLKSFANPRTGFKSIPCTTLQLHQRDGNLTP